jgi:hypothetical protein
MLDFETMSNKDKLYLSIRGCGNATCKNSITKKALKNGARLCRFCREMFYCEVCDKIIYSEYHWHCDECKIVLDDAMMHCLSCEPDCYSEED